MTARSPKIASTVLDTHYGAFEFYCFSWGKHEEDNILCLYKSTDNYPMLTRVQSACYTGEIFRSIDCDCHGQLDESLKRIAREGGLFVYMLCDGRGAGLYYKVLGLELGQTHGLDTSDAYRELGIEQDPRTYERVVEILKHLEVDSIRLMTNNPRKIREIAVNGISVVREPLEIEPTEGSRSYLVTKQRKMGHLLTNLD